MCWLITTFLVVQVVTVGRILFLRERNAPYVNRPYQSFENRDALWVSLERQIFLSEEIYISQETFLRSIPIQYYDASRFSKF